MQPEFVLFTKLVLKHQLGLSLVDNSMTHHGTVRMEGETLEKLLKDVLAEYEKEMVPCVLRSIKSTPMPTGDISACIFMDHLLEWARTNRKYCNEVNLQSALLTPDHKKVKGGIVEELLEQAGYIKRAPKNNVEDE